MRNKWNLRTTLSETPEAFFVSSALTSYIIRVYEGVYVVYDTAKYAYNKPSKPFKCGNWFGYCEKSTHNSLKNAKSKVKRLQALK